MSDVQTPSKGWVLACPRSGTRYVHDLLTFLGYQVGHDSTAGGMEIEHLDIEVTSIGIPFYVAHHDKAPAVWIYRHPLKVVGSMLVNATLNPFRPLGRGHLEMVMRFYNVSWHTMEFQRVVEFVTRAYGFLYDRMDDQNMCKLEDGEEELRRVLTYVGVHEDDALWDAAIEKVPTDTNRGWVYDTPEWESLPASWARDSLRLLAERLGY